MKGLLIKDILVQRKSLVLSAAIIVLYSILFSTVDFGVVVIAMTVMFSVIMTISTFTYDDMAHWNQYVHAYPCLLYTSIEQFNPPDGLLDVIFLFQVGAKGNHNSHCQ